MDTDDSDRLNHFTEDTTMNFFRWSHRVQGFMLGALVVALASVADVLLFGACRR